MKTLDALLLTQQYRQLPPHFYQNRTPTPLKGSRALVAVSADAAQLLDLDLCHQDQQQLLDLLSGDWLPDTAAPLAMKYAGHQFGFYNPALGDGRGVLLGEVRNSRGEHWELHLKGAGRTAFSRSGDGRAVLRSCIRELLGSEALFHLGIPTSRALAVAVSTEPVRRESLESAATLLRLSRTHLRFGHFEHCYYSGDTDGLQQLLDLAIQQHYPELIQHSEPAVAFLAAVQQRSVRMVASWQAYGFCHGVLNTDNLSILGETFDFGPFAFLDHYDPGFVCNHTDEQGRYAFSRQPGIVHWNLVCLAQALMPLASEAALREVLDTFGSAFQQQYQQLMAARLGVDAVHDWSLVERFLSLCEAALADWTQLLRLLAEGRLQNFLQQLQAGYSQSGVTASNWLADWQQAVERCIPDAETRTRKLCAVNPCVLPRSFLLQQAIEQAEAGDFSEVNRLLSVFRQPFESAGKTAMDLQSPPDWAAGLVLSCSS